MPFAGFPDFGACMNDSDMKKRYPKKLTRQKVCGKLQALHEKKHELEEIREQILAERKWLQKAVKGMKVGSFTLWCKKNGYGGVNQKCINAAAKKGGDVAKKALFAANASRGKFSYPKKK